MTKRAFYTDSLNQFLTKAPTEISGEISSQHTQTIQYQATRAWLAEIEILQSQLKTLINETAAIFFEFMIPRMGRRADVILTYHGLIFVLEFKIGSSDFYLADKRQAHGYALDLKNFHRGSHNKCIIPILVASESPDNSINITLAKDHVAETVCISKNQISETVLLATKQFAHPPFDDKQWASSGYLPTPTIIEAAQALYANHEVSDIARSEADTQNLGETNRQLLELIRRARTYHKKIICFVTGVPGAGKTLVGLNIASTHSNPNEKEYSVFLSGNAPLVSVLQEALAQDRHIRTNEKICDARRHTEQFIQNIHKFRDDALDGKKPPEQVAIFDEAQRAWDAKQASKFMQQKRNQPDFNKSEPEYLIEVMDRHEEWAVIVALIGGGQEIHTGEAGLAGWLAALEERYKLWEIYTSKELLKGEYVSEGVSKEALIKAHNLTSLHLATSMRSFRAEHLSSFTHFLVSGSNSQAYAVNRTLFESFPIKVTRDLKTAKQWLRNKTRATESMGMIASSNGIRLKASGIFVKNKIEPRDWFLKPPEDIRSASFLEDVATEFDIQGLELDWCLVAWDADYRFQAGKFQHWQFKGSKWQKRISEESQKHLVNAYRVLLTRARQGMVIFIPKGDENDMTRLPSFYEGTYQYLLKCGIETI
ncbi:DUF2075 domain-containing protein [Neptunomonas japonica]|uniref:Schlafen group 3-like DNA/RNA helicase domain-containing protein n=1 Tax=Neptunomonas japonica JAMM 1380 TaxID=1441457 RepID=A0A7R6SY82_9GAMM|nr:DUF2075 domain-containing protein [Neptunomonas japonica]BBB31472.1 conserved hypothetical protein [Neptunomonas japonica JAMM 1380]